MNINRDNYEEFFILYGDNELGSEDKLRVEAFVLENPDLQSEFTLLNQVRFTPDGDISYEAKESLMQAGPGKNEELLLLAVDNELSPAGQAELEELLARDKHMQAELALYKKASFDPSERIIFPYKESLYRKEEKARVIPFAWRRFAAAAAILVAVSVTAFIVFNGKENPATEIAGAGGKTAADGSAVAGGSAVDGGSSVADGSAVADVPAPGNNNTAPADRAATNPSTDPAPVKSNWGHVNDAAVGSTESLAVKEKADRKKTEAVKERVPVKDEEIAKTHNNLPRPMYNPNVVKEADPGKAQLAVNEPSKQIISSPQIKTDPIVTTSPADPYITVVNTMQEPGDDQDDQGPSSRKSKFRGFLRKVTRTFEKNTNIKATDEEDRLLVGGLAIRL